MINDLKYIQDECEANENYYQFGLSTLHCWIRFFEYVLHISYNLDFKKGSAATEGHKILKAKRKKPVQNNIRSKMSMLVDIVRVGSGTTNIGKLLEIA